jgi:hypothetical protein
MCCLYSIFDLIEHKVYILNSVHTVQTVNGYLDNGFLGAVHKLCNSSRWGGGAEGRLRTGDEKSIFVCYSIIVGVVLGNSGATWRLREGKGRGEKGQK